jgi:outer membrane protein assembly factor BamD (BamD/ComL family)
MFKENLKNFFRKYPDEKKKSFYLFLKGLSRVCI